MEKRRGGMNPQPASESESLCRASWIDGWMDGWLDEYVCVCVYNVAIMPYLATAVVRKERKKERRRE